MLRRFLTLLLLLTLLYLPAMARAEDKSDAAALEELFTGPPEDKTAQDLAEEAASALPLRDLVREGFHKRMVKLNGGPLQQIEIAGLSVSYWAPEDTGVPRPLVIFSHGFHGCAGQSIYLMKALAAAGYIVVAPEHKDSSCWSEAGRIGRPSERFADYAAWTDKTYADRADDIKNLYSALKSDKNWSKRIDWDRVALAGHSLGGYTVLGLAGAWKEWKMEGIKAVLALSPYSTPFADHGDLAKLSVPVMYQGGTRDFGITPAVKKKGGAFAQTAAPAWYVEFINCGHFSWTDREDTTHAADVKDSIVKYSLWFLDHALSGNDAPAPQDKGVAYLWAKKKSG